jgi:hypothetical protein
MVDGPKQVATKMPDLPRSYGRDRIVCMVRDPYWLHTYWELTRQAVARAEAALDGVPSYFPGGFAGASAYFHDAFTVSGGGCVNCFSQGFLLVSGTLAGGVTSTNPSGADATGGFTVGLWTDGGRSGSCEVHMGTSPGSNSPGFSCTAELLFAAGDVVHMDAVLSAGVTLTLGHGSVYGAAEFGDTAWITGLELLDSNRQAATGVTLISESGVDYTSIAENGAAPAPEPSTIILFAGALVLIAASRVSFRTRR